MRNNRSASNIFLYLSLIGIIGLSACKTGSKMANSTTLNKKQIMNAESLLNQRIDYKTFSAKSAVSIRTTKGNQQVSTNIRMRRDQDIWASVIALGIAEVARAYITPDSLKALNRINKKAYQLSYEEGLKLIQAEMDFPALQNVFIGNPLLTNALIQSVREENGQIVILQKKQEITQQLTFEPLEKRLEQQILYAPDKNFKCTIDYSKYRDVGNAIPFAHSQKLHIENKGEIVDIQLEFSKVSFDQPVKTEFQIPDSYSKAGL